MIRRYFTYIILNIFLSTALFAQEKNVELTIQFLTLDKVGEVNFKMDPFSQHAKKTAETLEKFFADYNKEQEIVVVESIYTDKDPEFTIHARPAMLVPDMEKIIKKLGKIKGAKAQLVQFHLAYIVQIKGGVQDKNAPYVPEMKVPVEQAYDALKAANLEGIKKLIQTWAREEALPVLAAFEAKVEAKYEGVKAMGELVRNTTIDDETDVTALTEGNPDYWRGLVEMTPGNQLIPTTKVFMHVAAGQFDYVRDYRTILSYFSDPKSVAGYYLKELQWRMEMFEAELEAQINGGIMMHDASNFSQAIKTHRRILNEYPNSAWARYELYYSMNSQNLLDDDYNVSDRSDWDIAKKKIFESNPLYNMDVRASSGKEAYFMLRRGEIQGLFNSGEKFNTDFINFGDIAFDLEVYGFAAHVYWLGISAIPKEELVGRDLLSFFLYSLDKLGETEIIKNFTGDIRSNFKKIEAEQERMMKASPIYQAFEKEE